MRRAVLWAVLALALGAVPARADDRSGRPAPGRFRRSGRRARALARGGISMAAGGGHRPDLRRSLETTSRSRTSTREISKRRVRPTIARSN